MNVCKDLEPNNVFRYFEELCRIPHGSGHTKAISDYCVAFAKEHKLEYWQDETNNIVIKKPGTAGYEASEPVIIQGHLDMVCEKDSSSQIDFEKDGLSLYVDGDYLKAKGTTLGGDDGIAVAYALALLDSQELKHPPLEIVFTVDEEVGMNGAQAMDLSMLQGHRMLNIDSDEEGILLTGCAGGLRADTILPVSRRTLTGARYQLKIHGLQGGHSGNEIHKEHANAIMVAGRVITELQSILPVALEELQGGLMDNAIPREVTAVILIEPDQAQLLQDSIAIWQETLAQEYRSSDPDIQLTLTSLEEGEAMVLNPSSLTRVLLFLRSVPYGVQNFSMEIPGFVETSLNPGILKLEDEVLKLSFSVRSSVTSRKYEVTHRLQFLTEFLGGTLETYGDYPAWEYRAESPLRDLMAKCYEDLFGKVPEIKAIHAGLECGILSAKIDNLDCISFGPENLDIHTPKERLSISSTERVWNLIIEYLRRAK